MEFALVRRNGPLRRLLAALAVSQVGDWLYNLAPAVVGGLVAAYGLVLWLPVAARPVVVGPVPVMRA